MNHTSPFGPMAGPVAETKSPRVRENVAKVETGQIRVGGITTRQVIRVGDSRRTPRGRIKYRVWVHVDSHGINLNGRQWGMGGEFYAKTIVTRWPDVEES